MLVRKKVLWLLFSAGLLSPSPFLAAQGYELHPGDVVIADRVEVQGQGLGAVRVLRRDGNVDTVFAGLPLHQPADVVIDRDGSILVSSWLSLGNSANGIYRIEPTNGAATRFNTQTLDDNFQFIRDAAGDLVVADGRSGIRKINRAGGVQTLSLIPSPGFLDIGIALDYNGDFIVSHSPELFVGNPDIGSVQIVDPQGNRTVLASNGNIVPNPNGVALDADGSILVTDESPLGFGDRHGLVRVERNGNLQTLSQLLLKGPKDVEVVGKGFYLLADIDREAVLLRKPSGDIVSLVAESDDGDLENGLPVDRPFGIAVVPHLWLITPDSVRTNETVTIRIRTYASFAGQEVTLAASENTGPTPMSVWWPGDLQSSHIDLPNALVLKERLDAQGEATFLVQVPNRQSLPGNALQVQAFLENPRLLSNPAAVPVRF